MKDETWKALGLIGIGFMIQNYISKKKHPICEAIGEGIGKTLMNLDPKPEQPPSRVLYEPKTNAPRVSYDSKTNTPRVSYDSKTNTSRDNILYKDITFKTSNEADEFMELVKHLFDEQSGYITVLQYMNIAGKKTLPIQNIYGWLSLNGMQKCYENGKFVVKMPWPEFLEF